MPTRIHAYVYYYTRGAHKTRLCVYTYWHPFYYTNVQNMDALKRLSQDHVKQDHVKQDHVKRDHVKRDHVKRDRLK